MTTTKTASRKTSKPAAAPEILTRKSQIAKAPMASVLATFNALSSKKVTRFATIDAGRARLVKLFESISADAKKAKAPDAKALLKAGRCPLCGGHESSQTAAGKEGTRLGDSFNQCHECGDIYHRSTGKMFRPSDEAPSKARSEGIRRSWADRDVAARRALKQRVKVGGAEYRSVLQAFTALGLPVSKHIAFRSELKAAGKATFEGHRFVLIAS